MPTLITHPKSHNSFIRTVSLSPVRPDIGGQRLYLTSTAAGAGTGTGTEAGTGTGRSGRQRQLPRRLQIVCVPATAAKSPPESASEEPPDNRGTIAETGRNSRRPRLIQPAPPRRQTVQIGPPLSLPVPSPPRLSGRDLWLQTIRARLREFGRLLPTRSGDRSASVRPGHHDTKAVTP